MNRRESVVTTLGGMVSLSALARAASQPSAAAPDLAALAEGGKVALTNRTVTRLTDGARQGVKLNEAPGEDAAFLPGIEFGNGTIECDLRGKNVPQQSFVGLAFEPDPDKELEPSFLANG